MRDKKTTAARHVAVGNLYRKAIIELSSTITYNKWDDLSGLVAYLKSHPFVDHDTFLRIFSSSQSVGRRGDIDAAGIRLMTHFLQAFAIARPSSVRKLKECKRHSFR